MSLVDRSCQKVPVQNSLSREVIDRTRDLCVVRFYAMGLSWRQIGAIMGISHEGARRRWQAIPPDVREYYSRTTLG